MRDLKKYASKFSTENYKLDVWKFNNNEENGLSVPFEIEEIQKPLQSQGDREIDVVVLKSYQVGSGEFMVSNQ